MSLETSTESEAIFEKGYGWRARIGMLVPGAVDETLSRQFYRMAPPGVTIVKASLGVRELTVDDINDALTKIEAQGQLLASRGVDCIIIGGSPTVVVGGPGAEVELARRVEQATGVPSVAAQAAALEAMRSLNLRRLAVATPFNDAWNDLLKTYLEANQFTVARIGHLGKAYRELMTVPVKEGFELAKRCFEQADSPDGIYCPGAPFPIADAIGRLERTLSTTVVTSLQASLWKGLSLASASDAKVTGYGKLLAD